MKRAGQSRAIGRGDRRSPRSSSWSTRMSRCTEGRDPRDVRHADARRACACVDCRLRTRRSSCDACAKHQRRSSGAEIIAEIPAYRERRTSRSAVPDGLALGQFRDARNDRDGHGRRRRLDLRASADHRCAQSRAPRQCQRAVARDVAAYLRQSEALGPVAQDDEFRLREPDHRRRSGAVPEIRDVRGHGAECERGHLAGLPTPEWYAAVRMQLKAHPTISWRRTSATPATSRNTRRNSVPIWTTS